MLGITLGWMEKKKPGTDTSHRRHPPLLSHPSREIEIERERERESLLLLLKLSVSDGLLGHGVQLHHDLSPSLCL
jgi:hypothetical protein